MITSSLYPADGENPSYGQLFIVDQEEASNFRVTQDPLIDYDLISALDTIIRNNNIFAKPYGMMKQEILTQRSLLQKKKSLTG